MNAFKLKLGLVAISGLALILTACPSGTDTGGTTPIPVVTAKYNKLGYVGVTNAGTSRSISGNFFKSTNSFAQPASATGLADDTCLVTKSATPPPPPDVSTLIANIESLDAGPELSLKKGTETLATLKPESNPIFPKLKFYRSDTSVAIPDTAGASLEIPGATDGFPAITVTLPNELAAFTFEPTKGVNKDTAFTWTSPTPDATVTISAVSTVTDASGVVSSSVYVYCSAKDNGSFSFPASTKVEMDAKGFNTSLFAFANKGISKFVPKGDALLIVSSTRSSTFVP
jgi:hypothetical protein